MIEQFDGAEAVLQVSAGSLHALAVTRLGQLFICGRCRNAYSEIRPIFLEDGEFDRLFIISAAAGDSHSAVVDSSVILRP